MKVKTIIIFQNGSISFSNKEFSLNTMTNQYLFLKKTDKTFFFVEKTNTQSSIHEQFPKHHQKYFK